jgi:probable selenium-dependent hydroxylase accessory protein YqeC
VESLTAWFEEEIFRQGAGKAGKNTMPLQSTTLVRTPSESEVLTVIGSGGKTSLIWHLARHLRGWHKNIDGGRKNDGCSRKILVTPTTKMLVPPAADKLYDSYCNGTPEPVRGEWIAASGITLAGIFNEETGKLESLPPETLERIIPAYDLVLIEGDGSRGLPLKGWAEHEPAVPPFTTITVGMLPLWPLGMKVSETIVHRLPLFSLLSGAKEGDIIKPEHLVRVITGAVGTSRVVFTDGELRSAEGSSPEVKGLFAAARGRRVLFLNQVEDDRTIDQARELISLLPEGFRSGLGGIIAGSVRQDKVTGLTTAPPSIPFAQPTA